MTIRGSVTQTMNSVLGEETTKKVRSVDRRARKAVIKALDVESRTKRAQAAKAEPAPKLSPEEKRQQLIEQLGETDIGSLTTQNRARKGLQWASPDPIVEYPESPMSRHQLLAALHEVLQPRTYFEIGVNSGGSLTLSNTRSVGVDPAYQITSPLHCDVRTYIETSDDFFALDDPMEHFEGVGIDLAFLDGMHLSDFTLRDFMNLEQYMSFGGVVVFDDMLPRNDLEAFRVRRTMAWAGDVYKVYEVLRDHRSDLVVIPINTAPTGTVLVAKCNPGTRALFDAYPLVEEYLLSPDPQKVPDDITSRAIAVNPDELLASDVWTEIVKLRDSDASAAEYAPAFERLRQIPTYGS